MPRAITPSIMIIFYNLFCNFLMASNGNNRESQHLRCLGKSRREISKWEEKEGRMWGWLVHSFLNEEGKEWGMESCQSRKNVKPVRSDSWVMLSQYVFFVSDCFRFDFRTSHEGCSLKSLTYREWRNKIKKKRRLREFSDYRNQH